MMVWVLGVAASLGAVGLLSGCSGFDVVNALAESGRPEAVRGVAYGPEHRQQLDVFPVQGEGRPVVVFFYGGNWQSGSRTDYAFVGESLRALGLVVIIPDYRLFPEVRFPVFVEDGARAVAWAHAHAAEFGGDPERLFLMGHSAGAHIAALLTLDARYLEAAGLPAHCVRGFIGLSGPYDFTPEPDLRPVFESAEPGSVLAEGMLPIDFVRGDAAPMLLIHGTKDTTARPGNSRRLAAAVRSAGGSVSLIEYRRGHASVVLALARGFRWLAPVRREVGEFVECECGGGG